MDERRRELALECAEAIGIKEISPLISEFKVKISDFPIVPGILEGFPSTEYKEGSLLAMGVVCSYGVNFTYIDMSGHTCLLPCTEVVKEELEKCGYIVCEHGKSKPNFRDADEEKEARNRVTLSAELADKVKKYELHSSVKPHEDYAYDVFADELYKGEQFGSREVRAILEERGYDNEVSKKLAAITGFSGESIAATTRTASDIKEFSIRASSHPILTGNSASYNALIEDKKRRTVTGNVVTAIDHMTKEELQSLKLAVETRIHGHGDDLSQNNKKM